MVFLCFYWYVFNTLIYRRQASYITPWIRAWYVFLVNRNLFFSCKFIRTGPALLGTKPCFNTFLETAISAFILQVFKTWFSERFVSINSNIKALNPSRPNPGRREKIKLNFYFCTSLWCLKRFYEGLSSRHEMSLRDLNRISIERDISETSQKHLKRDDFFVTSLRRPKNISKKISFVWCL